MDRAAEGDDFDTRFDAFAHSLFRLETLDFYAANGDALALFTEGEPLPPPDKSDAWRTFVRDAVGGGKSIRRVHVVPTRLTPYLRFEIEWGYAYNAEAGEEIHLLVCDDPATLFEGVGFEDFWLIDDEAVGRMTYDAAGAFTGALLVTAPDEVAKYRRTEELAMQHAVTLRDFLRRERNA